MAEEVWNTENLKSFEDLNRPNMMFLFKDEISFYRYYRQYEDEVSRQMILQLTIDEIIDSKITDENLITEKIKAVKEELKLNNSVEELTKLLDLKEQNSFYPGAHTRRPILELFEELGSNALVGDNLCFECEADIVTYGPFGCYTKATMGDLRIVPRTSGGDWDDVISSICGQIAEGADFMSTSFYRGYNFDTSGACNESHTIVASGASRICRNLNSGFAVRWGGSPFCAFMNNRISSIFVKAIWSGCDFDFDDVPD